MDSHSRIIILWILFALVRLVYMETSEDKPLCLFPDYLQTTESKPWVLNHTMTIVTYYVVGDEITAYDCRKGTKECSKYRRQCRTQFQDDRFLVQHIESDFTDKFLCLRFMRRSKSVIQVSTSHIKTGITNRYLCRDQWLSLDPWPWISNEHSIYESVTCPFAGGYNFKLFFNGGLMRRNQKCTDAIPPVRIESDCTAGEGVTFRFRNKNCLHSEGNLDLVQETKCIATWEQDGDIYAILRKNNDRYYWCIRVVTSENGDVSRIYVFLDMVCKHGRINGINDRYLRLDSLEKRNVTNVCADEFRGCEVMGEFCATEVKDVCPRTCGQCNSNDTMKYCSFPPSIHGNWVKSTLGGNQDIEIGNSSMVLPRLGEFRCVTFNSTALPLRRVLLQEFANGCYPRFTCFHYDTPSPAVMRFRTSSILQWPVYLSDARICDNENFKHLADPRLPMKVVHPFPLQSVVRESKRVNRVLCNLPLSMQKVSSFTDDLGGSGCIVHGTDSAPRRIFLSYFNGGDVVDTVTYNCVGSLTYISSHKSIIISAANTTKQDYLCWIVVSKNEIIQVPAASCNTLTANLIVQGDREYSELLMKKFFLHNATSDCISDVRTRAYLAQDWTVPPPFQQILSNSSCLLYHSLYFVILIIHMLFYS
ncbi:hypothetical protein SNE40_006992 [Patella caerulea]|uniref:ShKT domain-containing protein n=1 Tax=Patella caerulea TaxID=87958 RepID=A0AAN8JXM6_PATCE